MKSKLSSKVETSVSALKISYFVERSFLKWLCSSNLLMERYMYLYKHRRRCVDWDVHVLLSEKTIKKESSILRLCNCQTCILECYVQAKTAYVMKLYPEVSACQQIRHLQHWKFLWEMLSGENLLKWTSYLTSFTFTPTLIWLCMCVLYTNL